MKNFDEEAKEILDSYKYNCSNIPSDLTISNPIKILRDRAITSLKDLIKEIKPKRKSQEKVNIGSDSAIKKHLWFVNSGWNAYDAQLSENLGIK